MSNEAEDKPGVIAPPPLVYLGAIIVGALFERLWRWRIPAGRAGLVVGVLLIGAAIVLVGSALREFNRLETSPKPHKPTRAIVTVGPFRITRNPIYVSFALVQLGVGLIASSGWIVALLVPVLAIIRYGVIAREERYLERKFGGEYGAYKRRVRRWM
jgi:protein-S-isoprenylcysteine O-methyltransferase Ste14